MSLLGTWYGILAFMLGAYVSLDGRNFGAGLLSHLVAKEGAERRQVVAAIGPLWSWHEVWLVGFGGVLLLAFPVLLADAFSGYYLALFLILWCVVLRGISIEVGNHIEERLWQQFWDAVFAGSNFLLAFLFGAALGNVVRGVPLQADGTFHMPFFTTFRVTGDVGLLDWYTVPVAGFAVLFLAAHGATYLAFKTEGPVHDRSLFLARRLWLAVVPGFLVISALTWAVRPELFTGLLSRPLAWIGVGACAASLAALVTGLREGRERLAFLGSTFLFLSLVATGALTLYPVMLFSTLDPAARLTAAECAAPRASLVWGTVWWPIALVLAFGYFFAILRYYSGKVSIARDRHNLY